MSRKNHGYTVSEVARAQGAAISSLGNAAQWGGKRSPSRTIRVDGDVADKLLTLARRYRRDVASNILRDGLGMSPPGKS